MLATTSLWTGLASAQWNWQNPLPQGNAIYSLVFIDQSVGWASTSGGTLIKTTDGGETWKLVPIISRLYAQALFFLNDSLGWTGGQSMDGGPSQLLGTRDGGKSWSVQLRDSIGDFRTIIFVNERLGWASGQHASIYHTSDGGASWYLQTNPPVENVNSLSFPDSLHGWAACEINRRLHTTDEGMTWMIDTIDHSLYSISFLDTLRGWDCGEGKIEATTDGGRTWQIQLDTFPVVWNDIFVLNGNSLWAVSAEGLIAATTNGGATWNYQVNPTGRALNKIWFNDSANGVMVGRQGTILKSSNAGTSWRIITQSASFQPLYGVHSRDSLVCWAAGWRGTVLKTTNGGNSWDSLTTGTTEKLYDVCFVNDQFGWAVGNAGTIIRTTDGGTLWSLQPSPVSTQFTNIEFKFYPIGWIIGGDVLGSGHLLKSTDGGNSWQEETSVMLPGDAKRVQFASTNVGWILAGSLLSGAPQYLYRTTNGGISWQSVFSGTADTSLQSMSFVNESTGWVSTDHYTIYRTTDMGISWAKYPTPTLFGPICFVDTLTGWGGAPSSGEIYRTTDAGEDWMGQHSPMAGILNNLAFVAPGIGWAVGNFGAIIHTSSGGVTDVDELPRPASLPLGFTLNQNYPNPFNSSTILSFQLEKSASHISMEIFDLLGRKIHTLNVSKSGPGQQAVFWDGNLNNEIHASSGPYFYSLTVDGRTLMRKMLLLR